MQYPQSTREMPTSFRKIWDELVNQLILRDNLTFFGPANPNTDKWILTGVSLIRNFDVSIASADAIYTAKRFATLLLDLKTKGIVS